MFHYSFFYVIILVMVNFHQMYSVGTLCKSDTSFVSSTLIKSASSALSFADISSFDITYIVSVNLFIVVKVSSLLTRCLYYSI